MENDLEKRYKDIDDAVCDYIDKIDFDKQPIRLEAMQKMTTAYLIISQAFKISKEEWKKVRNSDKAAGEGAAIMGACFHYIASILDATEENLKQLKKKQLNN